MINSLCISSHHMEIDLEVCHPSCAVSMIQSLGGYIFSNGLYTHSPSSLMHKQYQIYTNN
jgi:hypothetical protein